MNFIRQSIKNLKHTIKLNVLPTKQHEDRVYCTLCIALLGYNIYNYDDFTKKRNYPNSNMTR